MLNKKIKNIFIIICLFTILGSSCILLCSCSKYDFEKDGKLEITLHPINAITGEKIKQGEIVQIEESKLRGNYHWLTIEYQVEQDKKFISKDKYKYSKSRQISFDELYNITIVFRNNGTKVYYKKWDKLSYPTGKGIQDITISFNDRLLDDDKITFTPSTRFESVNFQFQLEII